MRLERRGTVTLVDIRIGILNSPRELSFESSKTAAEIEQAVTEALASGTVLSIADDKGKQYVVFSAGGNPLLTPKISDQVVAFALP